MYERQPRSWVALSSPALERPLVPAVERHAGYLRAAAHELAGAVDLPFAELYGPDRTGLGFKLPAGQTPLRAAWALIGEWLTARAVGEHEGDATLAATHAWFWRGHPTADAGRLQRLGSVNAAIASAAEVHALLPYLLDPASVATRRSVINTQATTGQRSSRKSSGAYYTPGDVASHMVRSVMGASACTSDRWLDPAHGSGVFLRAVLSMSDDSRAVRDRLYGVDIDPFAAEATSFVLTAEDMLLNPGLGEPWERWHCFRRNLATGNSLLIDNRVNPSTNLPGLGSGHDRLGESVPWRLDEAFPEIGGHKFPRVVANPPYVPLEPNPVNRWLPKLHSTTGPSARADVSPVFVELCLELLADNGAMSVVTPLSTVTSSRSPFPRLRGLLQAQAGSLDFASFDRVPDALFGDDIKTRNAIVSLDRSLGNEITATPLRRWTSRRRELALEKIARVSVMGMPGLPSLIPKIGSEWERELYLACRQHNRVLDQWIVDKESRPLAEATTVDSGRWAYTIAVSPTAYNFLGVMRDPSEAKRHGHDSQNAVALLSMTSVERASAAYALLSSRLAFWMWHITGDGFHVTSRLPGFIPAPRDEKAIKRLSTLGEELWSRARERPVLSRNRGKTTVSYPGGYLGDLLTELDRTVDAVLGTCAAPMLEQWHSRLIVVDEDSDRATKIKRMTE